MKTIAWSKHFKDTSAMLDCALNDDAPLPDNMRTSRDIDRESWFGTAKIEDAQHLCMFGWPDGLKKIRHLTSEIRPAFMDLFPKQDHDAEVKYGIQGGFTDVGKMLGGDPNCMINFTPNHDSLKQGRSAQRLIIEGAFNCNINAETVFARGATIIAIIEAMELFGISMELVIQFTVESPAHPNLIAQTSVILKQFDEPIDYDKVAFAVAHPSFFRRLIFSVEETAPLKIINEFGFKPGGGYGRAISEYTGNDPTLDIYLTGITANADLMTIVHQHIDIIKTRFNLTNQTEDGNS